ncbi:hypothetical protein PVAND_013787 [Polypedilum vanderplanki]|uniref:Uncharacterized protein n=1 Tax=Polypedilum vanderplanki TaxID=319348 RepID=A0A9J6CQF9_POLVA|nr:hypothetical protein PVAND_013787 [Polypedilum vanderplanki]
MNDDEEFKSTPTYSHITFCSNVDQQKCLSGKDLPTQNCETKVYEKLVNLKPVCVKTIKTKTDNSSFIYNRSCQSLTCYNCVGDGRSSNCENGYNMKVVNCALKAPHNNIKYKAVCSKLFIQYDDNLNHKRMVRDCITIEGSVTKYCNSMKTAGGRLIECEVCEKNYCNGNDIDKSTDRLIKGDDMPNKIDNRKDEGGKSSGSVIKFKFVVLLMLTFLIFL